MELIHKTIKSTSRGDAFYIYPIGDTHIGALNCAEKHLRKFVKYIKGKPNAYWFGGGDLIDCIKPSDTKRFDIKTLPDWLFEGSATTVKERLADIVKQQLDRVIEILDPIKDKAIGGIVGNHESELVKYTNTDVHSVICHQLDMPNLTDCCFIRLLFKCTDRSSSIVIFAKHGFGGGRTAGAEPIGLSRLGSFIDADILLRGHTHSFRIEPREPHLFIPRRGELPTECYKRDVWKANWGCWTRSYGRGAGTYDSSKEYPPRPLSAIEIEIVPNHCASERTEPKITLREIPFE